MEERERYNEILENRGVKCGLFGIIGGWLLSNGGDLIGVKPQIPTEYPIFREQHNQHDWIAHLSRKIWFDGPTRSDFEQAFEIAKAIAHLVKDEA